MLLPTGCSVSFVGCSPEGEQGIFSSTYESVANIQPDPESIDQDSLKPDAAMRDVQEPSEPSTPIDKGIQSDLGGIAELEPESSTSPTLTTVVPKQPVLPEYHQVQQRVFH